MTLTLTDKPQNTAPRFSLAESRETEFTPGYAGEQSAKVHLLLGDQSPGEQEVERSFGAGRSAMLKDILANQERIEAMTARNDVMASISEMDPSLVTPEMVEVTQGLSMQDIQAPDLTDIIERRYAKVYTNTATTMMDQDLVDTAMEENPDAALDALDRTERVVYKNQMISTKAAELQKILDERSVVGTVWDFTERLIPFVEWYQKQNQVGTEGDRVSSILPGSNLQEQYSYLWNISDPKEFTRQLTSAVEDLTSRNPDVAMNWLQGLISYGGSDALLDNALGVLDVATAPGVGLLSKGLKGVARGGLRSPRAIPEIATTLGKYEDGAVGRIVEDIKTGRFLKGDINRLEELEESIPSLARPDSMLRGSKAIPREAYLRMKETLVKNSDLAARFLSEPNLIDRATPEELVQYRDVLRDQYVRDNPSVQKSVIDVEILPDADMGNVYQARVLLGKRDGTLFKSEKAAQNYVSRWLSPNLDHEIIQKGEGFAVGVRKTVDESKFLRDQFRIGTDQTTPTSLANTFGGWWRSPTYTISEQAAVARSTGVSSMESMKGIFEEMAQPLTSLPRAEMDDLEELLVRNRQSQMYYKDLGDFEEAFIDRFDKMPTEGQISAYFTYVQMNDLDLVIRDLDWYKSKAAQGRENISITISTGGTDAIRVPHEFEGKIIDSLPDVRNMADADFRWTVVKDGVASKTRSSRSIVDADRAEIAKLQDEGYKIVQVADQSLQIAEKEFTGFLVIKDFERARVGVKNVDRKPGGHKVDSYQGYIKQGKLARSNDGSSALYRGDTTLLGVKTQADGENFVKLLNEGREKYLKNEPGALKWMTDNLPIDVDQFVAAVKKGEIDLNTPFAYTTKGSRTIDSGVYHDVPGLTDLSKNIHNLDRDIAGRYSGSRDTSDIQVVRSEGESLFEVSTAEYLDPISTLRMSTQNAVSQRAMNDYTIMTTRNFIKEFGDILEGSPAEQMSKGNSIMFDPVFKSGAEAQNADRIAAAQNVSRAYKNLMNHGTALDRKIDAYKQRLIGGIYPKVGKKGQQWLDERSMFGAKDPGVYLRSFAFHSKLGLFNVNQLFIQANALVNVVSIGGLNGLRGGMSFPLMRAALLNGSPRVLDSVATIAQRTGLMKADEFKESIDLYRKSGFNSIGKDTAFLDDISGPEIKKSGVGQRISTTLDYGTTPFKEGERVIRMAAWNTAYLEAKRVAGVRPLNRREQAMVLQRAKLLGADMSRESNSAWQKGYAAVFSQFMSYQARLTEQFLGKRLTGAEKVRLFTGYSLAYGVPTAIGGAVGIIPVREVLMDTFAGMGISPEDENWRPLVDGFANSLVEMAVGKDLNISDRYGAGGLPTLYDLFRGDTGMFELLGGASGGIALQTASDALTLTKSVFSELFNYEGGMYNLTQDDILEPFRNVSSINNAYQVYKVHQLGIWASKSGINLMEMDLSDAVIAAVTGLQPTELGQTFRQTQAMTSWRESREAAKKDIERNYRKIVRMEPGPERDSAIRRNKAEMELNAFTPKERWEILRNATSTETMNDSVFERWEQQIERRTRLQEESERRQ